MDGFSKKNEGNGTSSKKYREYLEQVEKIMGYAPRTRSQDNIGPMNQPDSPDSNGLPDPILRVWVSTLFDKDEFDWCRDKAGFHNARAIVLGANGMQMAAEPHSGMPCVPEVVSTKGVTQVEHTIELVSHTSDIELPTAEENSTRLLRPTTEDKCTRLLRLVDEIIGLRPLGSACVFHNWRDSVDQTYDFLLQKRPKWEDKIFKIHGWIHQVSPD